MPDSRMRPAFSLMSITVWFIAASALIALIFLFTIIDDRVRTAQREALKAAVITRANGVQMTFSRALHEDWRRLNYIASTFDSSTPERMEQQLGATVADGRRISWAGFALVDGTVQVASGGLLKGQDVSSRPWFQRGLEGAFAGDMHEAKLLASLLPQENAEPLRFIDLAVPIAVGGETIGVLGMHLNFEWARQYLSELAGSLAIDVFLIGQNGEVIVATDGKNLDNIDVPSLRAARAGGRAAFVETWPDKKTYFAASIPTIGYADLPSFGWKLVARIPADAFLSTERGLSTSLVFYLGTFGAMLLIMSALFIQAFIRPFSHLARNAVRVSEGRKIFPYESNRTREIQLIGQALARLQLLAFGSSPEDDGDGKPRGR